jgi:hypothetical protein
MDTGSSLGIISQGDCTVLNTSAVIHALVLRFHPVLTILTITGILSLIVNHVISFTGSFGDTFS